MPNLMEQGNRPLGLASVPIWVRVVLFSLVFLLFVAAAGLLAASVLYEEFRAWSAPSIAFFETAGIGLMVLLVLFFVDRGRSPGAMSDLTQRFFVTEMPRALEKIDYDEPKFRDWDHDDGIKVSDLSSNVDIQIAYAEDATRAGYILTVAEAKLRLMAEFNIRRFNVTYVFEGQPDETVQEAEASLHDTLAGARNSGYEMGTVTEVTGLTRGRSTKLGWARAFCLTLHRPLDEGFLYDQSQRQFVAQDLTIMTRSLFNQRGHLQHDL